jgi:hypothetical protein
MEVERTAGTSKLIAIVLRRMGAQAGKLEVDAGEGSCWLRSHDCSSESPLEREECQRLESEGRRRAFRRPLFIGRLE